MAADTPDSIRRGRDVVAGVQRRQVNPVHVSGGGEIQKNAATRDGDLLELSQCEEANVAALP